MELNEELIFFVGFFFFRYFLTNLVLGKPVDIFEGVVISFFALGFILFKGYLKK